MMAYGSIISMEVSDDRIRVGDTITISAKIKNIGSPGAFHISQFLGWQDTQGIHYFVNEIEDKAVGGAEGATWSFVNKFNIHKFLLEYQRRRHRIRAYTITSRFGVRHPLYHPGRPIILPDEEMHDIKSIDLLIGERPIEEPEPRISPWVIIVLIAIVLIILLWKG